MKNYSLAKKLSGYSTFALSLASFGQAKAQHMVYTDVIPDTVVNKVLLNIEHYQLDLNNDNVVDFDLKLFYYYSSYQSDRMTILKVSPASGNAVMDNVQTSPFYHFALANNAGQPINAAQTWGSAYNEILARRQQSTIYSDIIGNWAGISDKYLGFKFQIGSATHFGWARLSVDSLVDNFTLKDYAYDSVANESFFAGLITAINQPSNDLSKVIVFNNELKIFSSGQSNSFLLKIFSIEGKQMMNEIEFVKQIKINLNDLPTGLYLLKLQDENNNLSTYKFSITH